MSKFYCNAISCVRLITHNKDFQEITEKDWKVARIIQYTCRYAKNSECNLGYRKHSNIHNNTVKPSNNLSINNMLSKVK